MVEPIDDDSPRSWPWRPRPLDEPSIIWNALATKSRFASDVQHGWGPVSLITIDDQGKRTAAADPRVSHGGRGRHLMTKLLVIRHGHAEGNAEHRFIGQTDVPLDDVGHSQAQALAERLHSVPSTGSSPRI